MSEDRLLPVRSLFGYLAALGPLQESLHADFEIHDHDIPDGQVFRGPEALAKWLEVFGDAWEAARLEPEELIPVGEKKIVVVAQLWARGKGSGVEVRRRDGIVCTLREGKVARLDYFGSKEEALAAAGISAIDPA